MNERCPHGMDKTWCALCTRSNNPFQPKRIPSKRITTSVHGANPLSPAGVQKVGYAIVRTKGSRFHVEGFSHLGEITTFVHIDGHPFIWAIKEILKRCPNLKTIQVIPVMYQRFHESHWKLIREKQVEVKTGHWRPDLAWASDEARSSFYQGQRSFLSKLAGEQKNLFDELVALGFDEALMTSRYFCLKGEGFISQHKVSSEFGYRGEASETSTRINAVLCYLDSTFETGADSQRRARQFKKRIERVRCAIEETKRANKMNGIELPKGLPLSRLPLYQTLLRLKENGELAKLETSAPSRYRVLVLRYGFEDNQFRTLAEVAKLLNDVTREWIRQLEKDALNLLDVSTEDED